MRTSSDDNAVMSGGRSELARPFRFESKGGRGADVAWSAKGNGDNLPIESAVDAAHLSRPVKQEPLHERQ
jgi:hypothetical protein